jgi:hypothetical protein
MGASTATEALLSSSPSCITAVRNRFSLSLKLTRQLLLAKRGTDVTCFRTDTTCNYYLNGTYSNCIYSQLLDQSIKQRFILDPFTSNMLSRTLLYLRAKGHQKNDGRHRRRQEPRLQFRQGKPAETLRQTPAHQCSALAAFRRLRRKQSSALPHELLLPRRPHHRG